MARERFRDAAGGGLAEYEFTVNHSEEEGADYNRNVTRQAVTTGPAFVLQQGPTGYGVFHFTGTILTQEQYDAMTAYYAVCESRTVFFRDFTGDEFEVVITRFSPQRRRTVRNPREPDLLHYWTYTLEMEVIS